MAFRPFRLLPVSVHSLLPRRALAGCMGVALLMRPAPPPRHSLSVSVSSLTPVRLLRMRARSRPRIKFENAQTKFTAVAHRSWMLRLSHENSYLSWTRNAAICAGVGATIMIVEMQFNFPMAEDFAVGFVDLGLLFISFGSVQHLYSAYRLRKLLQLSLLGYLWILGYTSFFSLLYFFLIQSKFRLIPPSLEEET